MSINFNPRNALSVAQNQYNNNSASSTSSATSSSNSSSNSSSSGSSGSSGSGLFASSWTGGDMRTNTTVQPQNQPQNQPPQPQNQPINYDNNHTTSVGHYLNQGHDYATATRLLAEARARQNQPQPQEQPLQPQNDWLANFSDIQNNIARQNQDFARQQMEMQRQQSEAWQKRQEEMQRNMARMQAENPNFATDRKLFEQMTGYATKNEQERKVVDDYWNNAVITKNKSANDYYNEIKSGVAIPNYEQNRGEYAQAQAQITKIGKYKQMSSGQLANLFKT